MDIKIGDFPIFMLLSIVDAKLRFQLRIAV
nr:MAG TPA: hypothetical protein [Caudoviricetes sp.]